MEAKLYMHPAAGCAPTVKKCRPSSAKLRLMRPQMPLKLQTGLRNRLSPLQASSIQPVGIPVRGVDIRRQPPAVFSRLDEVISAVWNNPLPGYRNDWQEVEDCWVLRPPVGRTTEAVVHFIGGSFVGAAPQLCYRLFLEGLALRNILVIATPYNTGFDLLRVADESQYKFERAMQAVSLELPRRVPVYGVGHSTGSMVHLLISSRYAVQRAGNVLMAYNNLPADRTFPFLSPVVTTPARILQPIVSHLTGSPLLASAEATKEAVRGLAPGPLKQLLDAVEQFLPFTAEVVSGKDEFTPSPEESAALIRNYYSVPRNLLLRFQDDTTDTTPALLSLLQSSPASQGPMELGMRTLRGGHLRPLAQAVIDVPPPMARMANQAVYTGGDMIGAVAKQAAQMGVSRADIIEDIGRSVSGLANSMGGQVGGPVADGIQSMADDIAAWMGVGQVVASGSKALAPPVEFMNGQNSQYGRGYANNAVPSTALVSRSSKGNVVYAGDNRNGSVVWPRH